MNDFATDLHDILSSAARIAAMKPVFPMKIASLIRDALRNTANKLAAPHFDYPGAEAAHQIETIGDCRYAISVTDANGTRYRVTVEVEPKQRSAA